MSQEDFVDKQVWIEPTQYGSSEDGGQIDHAHQSIPQKIGELALLKPESASPDGAIVDWVYSHNPEDLEQENWQELSANDDFFVAHRYEIIRLTIGTHLDMRAFDMMRMIKGIAREGEDLGNDIAQLLLGEYASVLLNCPELFPSFETGKRYIDTMIELGNEEVLLDYWGMIEEDQLQYAVDLVLEKDVSIAFNMINDLPERVVIPQEHFVEIAAKQPTRLLQALIDGRFPFVKKDIPTMTILATATGPTTLLERGLMDDLSLTEIQQVWGGLSTYFLLGKLVDRKIVETQAQVDEFIRIFGIKNALRSIRKFPKEIQSAVFQELVTGGVDEWPKYMKYFSELTSDDYIFILDHLAIIFDQTRRLEDIRNLFFLADQRFQKEFDEAFYNASDERQNESAEIERQNDVRLERYNAELSYLEAGSIAVEAYGYHDVLDEAAIIDALERNGCVKRAADIQEQATDTTRTNKMTCVEGSIVELATDNLGAGDRSGGRREHTEYVVIREYLRFLQTVQMKSDREREGFEKNLTYIGEKEYNEAVAGIALYWKWFLDSDEGTQLYVDTKVTDQGGSLKSDVYMLDRILAHFSDDELQKYNGRLLTDGGKVTQNDPSKVKAVLMDDWTISGSQLRGGYRQFVRDYPHLEKSLEVQLIAASRERIALGLEGITLDLKEETLATNVPTKVRAYYLAHDVTSGAENGARITGSHSSVDFDFASDIALLKEEQQSMPMIASVVRPYRQKDYSPVNIDRLKKISNTARQGAYGRAA